MKINGEDAGTGISFFGWSWDDKKIRLNRPFIKNLLNVYRPFVICTRDFVLLK